MAAKPGTLVDLAVAVLCMALSGCLPNDEPQTGSQTNWLRACVTSADCGSDVCQCGVCTHSCSTDSSCGDLPGSSCVAPNDPAAVALCDGSMPAGGSFCVTRCSTGQGCSGQQSCVSGVCTVSTTANAHVSIDLNTRFQSLAGLGATLAYEESDVTQYANTDELYAAMFADLGLDMLRLRNRYGTSDDNLASAATIVNAARANLGHRPMLVLASWSPPASLKANGSTSCKGEQDTCTMARLPSGGFDYEAYASYWRNSLSAYSAVGVTPDFIAIQNNPDYVPPVTNPGEGCKFLPTEGTLSVSVNGVNHTLVFPGFDRATNAVLNRLHELPAIPKIIAPEAEPRLVGSYVRYLDPSSFDAIGHHLYGSTPSAPDLSELRQLNEIGLATGRPVFQTEMVADGLGTAVLLHHTLVTEGASAYLHNALVSPTAEFGALIVVGDSKFTLQPAYHAIRQYARFTDAGWVRAGAESDQSNLLASTWVSPSGAVTVVIVNAGTDPFDVELGLALSSTARSGVTRTVFDGVERSADLGSLPSGRVVRLPGHSVVTIAFEHE
jgi:glucuronoarabinoxylan endo-1,4-beta-xylanase